MSDASRLAPASAQQNSSDDLQRRGTLLLAGSLAFIGCGLFCLLGGVEGLLVDCHDTRSKADPHVYLVWPCSLAYFWPLIIPLGTYIVIARWTGYKHFRHA